MSGLVFLLAALALSVVGSLALWLYQRSPTSFDQGIEDFSKEMRALAPPSRDSAAASPKPGPSPVPRPGGAAGERQA